MASTINLNPVRLFCLRQEKCADFTDDRFNRFGAVFDLQWNWILQKNHEQPTCHKYNEYPEMEETVGKMRIAVTLCLSQKA